MRLDSAGDRPSTSKVPIPRCLPLLATIILALLVGACGPGEAVPDAEATPELLSVRLVVAVNPLPGRQDATAILSSVAEDGGAERVEHEQLLTTRSVDFEVDVAGVAALMLGVAGRDALELVETDWLGAPGDGSLTIRVRPVGMEYCRRLRSVRTSHESCAPLLPGGPRARGRARASDRASVGRE
jgi:hypothetical protein